MSYDNEATGFSTKKVILIITLIATLVVGICIGLGSWYSVPQGETGIVKTWGEVTAISGEGGHWKNPISDSVEMFNVKIQDASMKESTATKDQQEVTTEITINYHIEKSNVKDVYTRFGQNIEVTIINPIVQEALKASTAQYTAEQLTSIRETVKTTIDVKITNALAQYGVTVDEVSITNFSFSTAYQSAIDAKAQAVQEALKAENDLRTKEFESKQQIITAQAQAEAAIIAAQGQANATMINANATATAMEIINSQLTPEYVQYLTAMGWNGELPIYWSGDGSMPLLLVPTQNPTNSTTPP